MTGIYKIVSKVHPDRIYVGSAIKFNVRFNEHRCLLKKDRHHSPKLQCHFNKYGMDDFVFEVIESFEFISKEHLLLREQYYIDLFKPWFNINLKAESRMGVKMTEEQKANWHETHACLIGRIPWNKGLKNCWDEETLSKITHKGRKQSVEEKEMRSVIMKGKNTWMNGRPNCMKGKKHSEKARANMKEGWKNAPKKIIPKEKYQESALKGWETRRQNKLNKRKDAA
jgi:group I intron endonuclease